MNPGAFMTFLRNLFRSDPVPRLKPEFDASVAQRLTAAGKDPRRIEAIPAELVEMPEKPGLKGFQGTVRLELTLDEAGRVHSVQMDGAPFDHVATLESWALGWTFTPAKMEGKVHPCRMVFEVSWS
jgi:hypothetical protein